MAEITEISGVLVSTFAWFGSQSKSPDSNKTFKTGHDDDGRAHMFLARGDEVCP